MKILMIGNKSSGKTTYMMSSYGHLQRNITGGFTVKTVDSSDHSSFVNQYNALKISGAYPPATMKRSSYNLNLFYNGNNVHSFEWNDFNGGIIDERVTENTSILKNDMASSDGLMLFFDAVELKNNTLETRVRQIIRLIASNLKSIEKDYFLSIIITKADLVRLKFDDDFEIILKPIEPLLNILSANENITCQLIPVCCTKEKFVNVDYPILYMLHGGMYNECIEKQQKLQQEINTFNTYNEQSGFFDDIKSFFYSEPTYRELAYKKQQELIPQINYYEEMENSLQDLINYLQSKDLLKGFSDRNNKYSF
ncbi:hypothetical protein FACS189434_14070 [Bacteroidia bacterium]|nr:hypothetical protein FACS189434_14070 [Bacteroidia bacterium]